MIRGGGVFFVAARPTKLTARHRGRLELNPMSAAEVVQAALARESATFGTPRPMADAALDGDWEPSVRIKVRGFRACAYLSWCRWCKTKPHLSGEQAATDEVAVPPVEFDFAELGREDDHSSPTPLLNAAGVQRGYAALRSGKRCWCCY